MTEAEAQARLERMVAYDVDPTLTAVEVADLLALAKLADAVGLPPTDATWTPTYDLNRAAAEGWRWKASKASAQFNFATDGQTFARSQIAQACLEMAKRYARKVNSNIILPGALATEA